ncbi:hypothetical protein D779_2333 [Imhoffiella purpurea]|uniref:Uncharacterized protein n=1 Tax=Imhoffiella purpurea TaxID=1249627 RepID=W9V5J6_9GAMM|nr:hypothetical protein D779_2333 [Imhoffiella purpurea]
MIGWIWISGGEGIPREGTRVAGNHLLRYKSTRKCSGSGMAEQWAVCAPRIRSTLPGQTMRVRILTAVSLRS